MSTGWVPAVDTGDGDDGSKKAVSDGASKKAVTAEGPLRRNCYRVLRSQLSRKL